MRRGRAAGAAAGVAAGRVAVLARALAAAVALGACGEAPDHAGPPAADEASEAPEAGHAHAAPHGGALVELGEEAAHLELLLDPATGTLTAYVLDGHAEHALRISAPLLELRLEEVAADDDFPDWRQDVLGAEPVSVLLRPVASVLTGETVGDTSQYSGSSPWLVGRAAFGGRLPEVSVRGVLYRDVAVSYPGGHQGP